MKLHTKVISSRRGTTTQVVSYIYPELFRRERPELPFLFYSFIVVQSAVLCYNKRQNHQGRVAFMEKQSRKPNRLNYYDYGDVGCYFITLCTHHRQPLFRMEKSAAGNSLCAVSNNPANQIIHKWIAELHHKFEDVTIDQYVIMPDHLHFIVNIKERCPGCAVPDVMRFFKTMTTNEYIRGVKHGILQSFDKKLWQKSYYDHIIRNQQDYNEIWEYIENNPDKWMLMHNRLQ